MIADHTSTMIAMMYMAVLLKMIILGLGNIDNSALQLLQQIKRHCDYCCDTKLEYFTTGHSIKEHGINKRMHHYKLQ